MPPSSVLSLRLSLAVARWYSKLYNADAARHMQRLQFNFDVMTPQVDVEYNHLAYTHECETVKGTRDIDESFTSLCVF